MFKPEITSLRYSMKKMIDACIDAVCLGFFIVDSMAGRLSLVQARASNSQTGNWNTTVETVSTCEV